MSRPETVGLWASEPRLRGGMREEVIKVNQNWAGSPGRLQLGLYKVEHIDMGSAGRWGCPVAQ